jgi:hypothetical protein
MRFLAKSRTFIGVVLSGLRLSDFHLQVEKGMKNKQQGVGGVALTL